MGRRSNTYLPAAATVGENVSRLRTIAGLSQRELDRRTQEIGHRVPYSTLALIETGMNKTQTARMVTVDQLVVLAKALEVPVMRLLREPQCRQCWDAPPAGFACSACQASTPPTRSPSARGPQTTPKAAPQRP